MTKESNPIRAFFAIDFTECVKQCIGEIILGLQSQHTQSTIHWIKPNNLHITLHFLPAIELNDINKLIQYVRSEINSMSAFELSFDKIEFFPNPHRPRIISLHSPQQDLLADLAKKIGMGIVATNYPIETRPFRGHLTLAKLSKNEEYFPLAEINLSPLKNISINSIVLYRSDLHNHGSSYTVLERIELKVKNANTPS